MTIHTFVFYIYRNVVIFSLYGVMKNSPHNKLLQGLTMMMLYVDFS